jgi:hypothetical protein
MFSTVSPDFPDSNRNHLAICRGRQLRESKALASVLVLASVLALASVLVLAPARPLA